MPLIDHAAAAFAHGLTYLSEAKAPDPEQVTPGFIGFIATFGVAAIVILLVIDMVRRIRRVNYRAQVHEQLAREAALADSKPESAEQR